MAFEQGFLEPIMHFGSDGDVSIKQKKATTSVPKRVSKDVTSYFDCNICLDSAHDPVVSFCGHLYCWPCIYKWLEVQSSSSSSSESAEQPKCPVCNAYISKSSFVPLYGHDLSSSSDLDTKKLQLDLPIPQRPPALGMNVLLNTPAAPNSILNPQLHPNHFHPRPPPPPPFYLGSYAPMGPSGFGGTAIAGFFSPTIGMMFGSVDTTLFAYPSFNGSRPRMRRQEMQVDKSLNRLYIFLLCCLFLCLLVF